ncbi:putative bifunctional diguanylate cyclase/phosphodiesterase [Dactylosporangium sp. CA-052675]|uniref:putative bifunctional diguanylate cyclase/phosphodiesterase n=1 Tax=Dactylosporangium sp. CA-052675 TaxID=3239927 RepID=UPI003D931350
MRSTARTKPRDEPDGEFRRVAGRAISAMFIAGGLLTLGLPLTLSGMAALVVGVVGVVAMGAGFVMWRLPWHRWPRRASLWTVVPALLLLGVGNWAEPDPYLAAILYFLLAVWVGTAQRRGTTLALSPALAIAYWIPLAITSHAPGLERSVYYVTATCVLAGESVGWITARLHDVQRRLREQALTEQAFTDQLTGLPSRALLLERAEQVLLAADRRGGSGALLLIDLDRFKEVNDTLGHHNGDLLLRQVAGRLTGVLRERATVARLGGDEFAVLLADIDGPADAIAAATEITAALDEPFVLGGLSLEVDSSIGVAVYPDHARNCAELLRRADVAMYAAKEGHEHHVVYDPRFDRHNPYRLGLLGQLRRAIAAGELVIFYQPKADAGTGRVLGAEALVRWQHPEHGLLGPNEFIPIAETTGLIRQLTSYVLETALRDCHAWRAAGHDISVSVNVSARCLLDLELPEEIRRLTEEHDVPADRLVVEITESVIMTDPDRALQVLDRLHALGVRLSIDDFGTGYSSLAYLKNLPVQELKVDRSFVTHMRERTSELAIVRSTVDLGHNLGMQVVAEGVEDAATWEQLHALGCDEIQGYYLGRPMPSGEVVTWLGTRALATHGTAALGVR